MSTEAPQMDVESQIRPVTDEEAAFFRKNGWAKLENLITPELAATVLERVKLKMGDDGRGMKANANAGATANADDSLLTRVWERYDHPSGDDEMIHQLVYSRGLGQNASRLLDDRDIRYYNDGVNCKLPATQAGVATPWHQDLPYHPFDRVGSTTFWLALVDMEPEMGTMRFLSGTHRVGNLGRFIHQDIDALKELPWLTEEYEMSPPLALKAGDATVHSQATMHAAPENSTDRPRWSMTINVFPADALYTGAPYPPTDNLGLQINQTFDVPEFPIINR
jgi:hypothetical protein